LRNLFLKYKLKQIPYQKNGEVLTNKDENYAQWYNDLVIKADLAENSAVRRMHGYKTLRICNMGKKFQAELDRLFKATGHVNAYFPLFIPKSFFSKEAAHVKGLPKNVLLSLITDSNLMNPAG